MPHFILADPQDITRAGVMYLLSSTDTSDFKAAADKTELLLQLKKHPDSVVVMDYTLFDVNDIDELQILSDCYPQAHWVIFSAELTSDFARRLLALSPCFSIQFKDSSLDEIRQCLRQATQHRRFICQRMAEQLLVPAAPADTDEAHLTRTETEVLKDIAMGMTTKEIAEKRISSFHTINTHRKNIFRKIGVNNVHEATRYALRAGLIDAAEYYI